MTEITYHGRVIQDGQVIAECSAWDHDWMNAELLHYAAQYVQDGPVLIEIRAGKSKWKKVAKP